MINVATKATVKYIISLDEYVKPYFTIFSALDPNIIGIPIKNENSTAILRETPVNKPPTIVEPLLEVPGIKANI